MWGRYCKTSKTIGQCINLLFSRCRDSKHTEAYLPCTIALYRVQILEFWLKYQLILQVRLITVITTLSNLSYDRLPLL